MSDQRASMTPEELIFALGYALGMISRLASACELLRENSTHAQMKQHVLHDIDEARDFVHEVRLQFYGLPAMSTPSESESKPHD